MPHIPQDFRPVPGAKARLASGDILDNLPVSPEKPRTRKSSVPVGKKRRRRKRSYGVESLSIRKFTKTPDEVWKALTASNE